MAKIALIKPNTQNQAAPHLGLGYLSSYAKKNGHDALIIDGQRDLLNSGQILEIIQKNDISIAGITCLSGYYNEVVTLSRYLKSNGIKIVIGGVHPTFMPYQTLLDSSADYVICGEGEVALSELLDNDFNNIPPPPQFLDGLPHTPSANPIQGVYSLTELRDATTPFQKARCVHNLDDLPFPDWDQMPPCEYPPYGMGVIYKKRPVGVIMTSRGCSAKCKFCSSTNFYGVGVRFRSPENVVDEIQYLKERFGIKEFQFYDDNVILKRSHIERICRITLERNINLPWMLPNGIRADCVDNELAKLMKKSGCYYSGLGIESANDNILKNIEKNESVAVMSQAIKTLERNGIDTGGFFILGLPGETKTTLQNTINFAVNSALSFANFYKFTVLPGCEFWKELDVKMESFYKKTYEGGYVPEGLCKKDLDDARFSAYIKFFLRPRAIVKFLKYFHFVQIKYLLRRMFDFGLLPKKNKK